MMVWNEPRIRLLTLTGVTDSDVHRQEWLSVMFHGASEWNRPIAAFTPLLSQQVRAWVWHRVLDITVAASSSLTVGEKVLFHPHRCTSLLLTSGLPTQKQTLTTASLTCLIHQHTDSNSVGKMPAFGVMCKLYHFYVRQWAKGYRCMCCSAASCQISADFFFPN